MQLEPLKVVGDVLRDKIANLDIESPGEAAQAIPNFLQVGRTAPAPRHPGVVNGGLPRRGDDAAGTCRDGLDGIARAD